MLAISYDFSFQTHVWEVPVPLPPRCATLLPCLPVGLFTPRGITLRGITPRVITLHRRPPTPIGKPNGNKSCKEHHQPRCEGTVQMNIKKNQMLNPHKCICNASYILFQSLIFLQGFKNIAITSSIRSVSRYPFRTFTDICVNKLFTIKNLN